jgi:hypothetical protein
MCIIEIDSPSDLLVVLVDAAVNPSLLPQLLGVGVPLPGSGGREAPRPLPESKRPCKPPERPVHLEKVSNG